MEYYIAEGSLATTFGVRKDGSTFIQMRHPSGELGTIQELEQYNNWNLQRWIGQMSAEKQDNSDDIPDELIEYVQSI